VKVAEAVAILRAGGLVAFPTETVYGLGADARSPAALARLFAVKGRPADHPVIVHLAGAAQLDEWAVAVPDAATALAEAFWPGPLTLLVPRAAHVLDAVTGGRPAVGLRVPAQPLALELLDAIGGGIAAPSANRFGRVSPTTAEHVRADLGDDVDLVLDGGPTAVGVESTIVDTTTDPPAVLRPGGAALEDLRAVVPALVDPGVAAGPARAPGMLVSHYAPRCRVELADDEAEAKDRVKELAATGVRAGVLDFGADVATYAHELYGRLRDADHRGLAVLVAVLPSPEGIGVAVRDRLTKAAAARP
jgi:L-threonylcarbamoyladenylate synthase